MRTTPCFCSTSRGASSPGTGGAQRIKGYTASEIIGRHFSVFYPPESASKPEAELRIAARDGRVEDEGWRLRKDGSRFWANVVITALRDEKGRLKGFGKVTRDLTDRRAVVEALRRSEERFRMLIDGIADYAVYMLDPTGHVSTWNSGAERIKGYTPREIIGRHYSAFFAPEDIAAGKPEAELARAQTEGRHEEEAFRIRKDGTRFWANVVLTPLRDEAGALLGFAKVTRDLTARRKAEETARALADEQTARAIAEQAEELVRYERERYKALSTRLEVILEGVGDGVTVQDQTGAIVFANSAAARLCGYPSAQALVETPVSEIMGRFEMFDEAGNLFSPDAMPGRKVLRGEPGTRAIARVRERDSGRQWWTAIRAHPVRNDAGEPELAVNVWHDITVEHRRDEHERYVARATATLATSLDYPTMLRALADLLVPGLADWCSIHLEKAGELENVAVTHCDPSRLAMAREYTAKFPPLRDATRGLSNVLRTGQSELYPVISDELLQTGARDPEHLRLLREIGMSSLLIVPIRIRDTVTGTLSWSRQSLGGATTRLTSRSPKSSAGAPASLSRTRSSMPLSAEHANRSRSSPAPVRLSPRPFTTKRPFETSSRSRSQRSAISRSSMSSKATTCGASPRPTAMPNSMPSSSEPLG